MIIVLTISELEDFHWPEIPLVKTREIDNEARILKKAEMKNFKGSQKGITPSDIQLSSLTSLIYPATSIKHQTVLLTGMKC